MWQTFAERSKLVAVTMTETTTSCTSLVVGAHEERGMYQIQFDGALINTQQRIGSLVGEVNAAIFRMMGDEDINTITREELHTHTGDRPGHRQGKAPTRSSGISAPEARTAGGLVAGGSRSGSSHPGGTASIHDDEPARVQRGGTPLQDRIRVPAAWSYLCRWLPRPSIERPYSPRNDDGEYLRRGGSG